MSNSYASVENRAIQSEGTSADAIYGMVGEVLRTRGCRGGCLLDVGCGRGRLRAHLVNLFDRYAGADVVRYDDFLADAEFYRIDLDSGRIPLDDGAVDAVVAVETIEHLENPRAFARELTRLCKPGGVIVVTTPNQLSFLSKLSLMIKNRFPAFSDSNYPAHLTALLEVDLRRIAAECGWRDVQINYTCRGRIPGTKLHWPTILPRMLPRAFSDNFCVAGIAPSIQAK
ncbi:MAG: class I SAM-dependent methyltransferase [Planctomycetales bacterium]|nr:class I SAM-dependent methyltransferase [Planctomycetales bacterium]MBN8629008.1 class I SAM-dependent methyltransferase [Planctomycetota bacterium]